MAVPKKAAATAATAAEPTQEEVTAPDHEGGLVTEEGVMLLDPKPAPVKRKRPKKVKEKAAQKPKPAKATKKKKAKLSPGVYMVEEILDHTWDEEKQCIMYKVKWVGYSKRDCTWEPRWNLSEKLAKDYNIMAKLELEEEEVKALEALTILRNCALPVCTNVETTPMVFLACSGCVDLADMAVYCSEECQVQHWPKHKMQCCIEGSVA